MKLLVDYTAGGNNSEKISWFRCRNGHVSIGIIGCFSFIPNKMREEAILVEKDKVKALEVDIDLGVGEMNVSSGAKEWVEGNAEYNVKS